MIDLGHTRVDNGLKAHLRPSATPSFPLTALILPPAFTLSPSCDWTEGDLKKKLSSILGIPPDPSSSK